MEKAPAWERDRPGHESKIWHALAVSSLADHIPEPQFTFLYNRTLISAFFCRQFRDKGKCLAQDLLPCGCYFPSLVHVQAETDPV